MTTLTRLPIGLSSWAQIRREQLFFCDKTEQLSQLVQHFPRAFLAAPRRSGKTLLCSQLTELYTSGTELFTGTKAEFRWPQSARAAVVNLKFGTVPANQNFEANLCVRLATAFIMAGLVESTAALEQENLVTLMAQLELLTQGQDLVVLIDEWDKPLSAGTDRAIEARLNSFYAWLSSLENIKFLLISGIMHYRETEVFLGPDLRDLGQEPCAPALLGLTLDEVSEIYSDYLDQATQRLNTSREVLLAQIKQHYGQNGSYSPWVLNQFFEPLTLPGELKPQWVKFR